MKDVLSQHLLRTSEAALRHRFAAVILDAMGELGITATKITTATRLPPRTVALVLAAERGPKVHDIVAVGLACGIRFGIIAVQRCTRTEPK